MIDLSVVIVNYNNWRVLEACLPSLFENLKGVDAEVIVSDNGSVDGSLDWIRTEFPGIRVLENRANLGFAEANNRAFAIANGRYVLLLNPDTVVHEGAIERMIAFLADRPHVGAVGCKLLNGDGSRQVSARAFPSALTYAMHFSGLAYRFPDNRFCGKFHISFWDGETPRKVDWVCGAVILTRKEVLDRVGGLDPYFFLTYDEVDWCHRVKKKGYEVWYTPDAVITHLDRQSEPQSNPNPKARIKYMTVERNSRVRYFAKHRSVIYAALVETVHLILSAIVWIKANTLGSNQSRMAILERRLFMQLYWNTALRLPRAIWSALTRRLPGSRKQIPFPLFINPYLADDR